MKVPILITSILFYCMALLFMPQPHAEDIKNYSNCDVCHGAIHFSAEEAQTILGLRGYTLISQLKKGKVIFLDQNNAILKGKGSEVPSGAELQIRGQDIIFIKNIHDSSLVQIVTDRNHAMPPASLDSWRPEIYLESGHDNEIHLDDSVALAWEKMESSTIYGWLLSDSRVQKFAERSRNEIIAKKILNVLELMSK